MIIRLIVLLLSWVHLSQHYQVITPSALSCQPCRCYYDSDQMVADCSSTNNTVPSSVPSDVNVLLMRENNIHVLKPKSFFRFSQLNTLDLSDNAISYIHVDAFNNLTNLQVLRLQNNKMVSYPDKALSVLTSLVRLHMDGLHNESFGEGFHSLKHLSVLDVSGGRGIKRACDITTLLNNTFIYLSQLNMLSLTLCNISNIELAAFLPMTSLHTLDLSYNRHLGFSMLGRAMYGFQNSSLKILKINGIVRELVVCVVVTMEHLKYFQNTSLESVYVDGNRIEVFEYGALKLMPPTLRYISAKENRFIFGFYIYDLEDMPNVTNLIIENNNSPVDQGPGSPDDSSILDTYNQVWHPCTDCNMATINTHPWQTSFQNDVYSVIADDTPADVSDFKPVYKVPMPPHLQILTMTKSHYGFRLSNIQFSTKSISFLNMSFNLFQTWSGPIYGVGNVTHMDLSHNMAWYISDHFFKNCSSLQYLNISHNRLGKLLRFIPTAHFLQPLNTLRFLDLSHCDIHRLSDDIFEGLASLETLIVTDNVLYLDWPLRINMMKNLKFVNFSHNQIRWLSDVLMNDFDQLSEAHNITLDLSYNPLACICDKLYFIKWIINSRINFYNKRNYYCILENGNYSNIGHWEDNYDELRSQCQPVSLGLLISIFFSTLTLIAIIIAATIYRHRWKMRYWFYAARLKYRNLVKPNNGPFDFDAFVSYCDKDEFVETEMLNRVETSAGLKLNIHRRDFVPGAMIVESIISAIQKSRKTLVVLSRNFITSEWCLYELQMAIMEAASTGRDLVVLIMLEFIPYNDLPKVVRCLTDTDSYIDYEQFENKDVFWERVITSLNNP